MRRLVLLSIGWLAVAGCGGTLVLRSDSPGGPRPRAECPAGVSERSARDIAMRVVGERCCGHAEIVRVRSDANRWRVDVRGCPGSERHEIRVDVDRRSGEVVGFRCKAKHKHHGKHGDA